MDTQGRIVRNLPVSLHIKVLYILPHHIAYASHKSETQLQSLPSTREHNVYFDRKKWGKVKPKESGYLFGRGSSAAGKWPKCIITITIGIEKMRKSKRRSQHLLMEPSATFGLWVSPWRGGSSEGSLATLTRRRRSCRCPFPGVSGFFRTVSGCQRIASSLSWAGGW